MTLASFLGKHAERLVIFLVGLSLIGSGLLHLDATGFGYTLGAALKVFFGTFLIAHTASNQQSLSASASAPLRLLGVPVLIWLLAIEFGDTLYAYAVDAPETAMAIAVAVLVAWEWQRGLFSGAAVPAFTGGMAASFSTTRFATPAERNIACAHEAGHLLVYAAMKDRPADLVAQVMERPNNAGVLGNVSSSHPDSQLTSKVYAEWLMLFFLAGQAAEEVLFGESSLGATGDQRRWQAKARDYLASGHGPFFYYPPSDEREFRRNEEILECLRNEQRKVVSEFLAANKSVLEEAAKRLNAEGKLVGAVIDELFAQAQVPEAFPQPTGWL